jgi:broad specificity phosphatase PhoE
VNTRISLVRHGVTEWNYAGRVQGRSDVPLAPEGERQAEAVAERLAGEPWDAIYSSPLGRANQTALAISRRIGHSQVKTDARLAERHMGEAEGMPDIDLPMLWPGVPWDSIPGMEPIERLAARAHEVLREIAIRHPSGRVICVTHGSLISTFLRSLMPPGVTPLMGTHQRNTSITIVRYDGKRFTQDSGPDHRHLLQDGVEYAGEKGRVSGVELAALLMGQQRGASLEPVIWGATAIETAWVDDKLVGFARAFSDGLLYGCIDIAVVLPTFEDVRPVLIHRLESRYPDVQLTVLFS